MAPIRCIIVDDEPLALQLLEGYVARTPFLELAGKFSNGTDALDALRGDDIRLAFLDIQMNELNGLELARMADDCAVVFTTAFEQYALEGYRVNALDYLLKPFSYAEFLAAADKARRWIELQTAPRLSVPKDLLVKSGQRQIVLPPDEIVFVEAERDYIRFHLTDGQTLLSNMNLKTAEELLPADRFLRVHRSFIVHVGRIREIERNTLFFGKTRIVVSEAYRDELHKRLKARTSGK